MILIKNLFIYIVDLDNKLQSISNFFLTFKTFLSSNLTHLLIIKVQFLPLYIE